MLKSILTDPIQIADNAHDGRHRCPHTTCQPQTCGTMDQHLFLLKKQKSRNFQEKEWLKFVCLMFSKTLDRPLPRLETIVHKSTFGPGRPRGRRWHCILCDTFDQNVFKQKSPIKLHGRHIFGATNSTPFTGSGTFRRTASSQTVQNAASFSGSYRTQGKSCFQDGKNRRSLEAGASGSP